MFQPILLFTAVLCIAVCFFCIAAGLSNQRNAGNVKLSIGWFHKNGLIFTVFFSFTLFISNMVVRAFRLSGYEDAVAVIAILCVCIGGFFFFRSGLSRFEIRENGIVDFWLYVRWDEIESYRWEGSTVQVNFRKAVPLYRKWHVPIAYKDDVEQLLYRYTFPDFDKIQQEYRRNA